MGLDMNLYDKNNNEIMYWRKANQIREWLVRHNIIQDDDNCVDRVIYVEQLQHLLDDCKKVLEDHSLAESLMPCSSGFFFGSETYGEWYFQQLQETVDKLQPIVNTADVEHDHYIYSDWW